MPFDQIIPPIGTGLFLTGAAYAAFSALVSGQVIGTRVIEKSNWMPRCEQALVLAAKQDAPTFQTPVPTPDCNSIMGMFAGPEGKQLCNIVGPLFQNPLAGQIEKQNQELKDAYNARLKNAAAHASSSCKCAVNVQLEDRMPWALYAGSARLITPSKIRNLDAELFAALSSPVCAGRFQ
ncbi:hypothetical protein [Pararhizobium sp. IMCC21322]|uniref:hypothetical protein n=1 Tax=Pararhizobium sp. IMCC21322 TaxID=3067903 RepID=UPI00274188FE|nr:hypothetical protein [Pararhizobium sp. IMCC21322]